MSEKEIRNPLQEAIDEINRTNPAITDNPENPYEIVDIITFCLDPRFLNLPGNNLKLFPAQEVILRAFYMGSHGNEKLQLTQANWEWLYANEPNEDRDGAIYEKNMNEVIAKLKKKEKKDFVFNELHLVMGRRGTKTVIASIITSYEVYKLLRIGKGNPHAYYGLPDDDPIAIINVALSQDQAGVLFEQIQARIRNSVFFTGRIAKGTTQEIRFYTDSDLNKMKAGSNLQVPGSVMIKCGHSNPDTLRGRSTILILFDELAFYDQAGKVNGKKFYNTLKPSLTKFYKYGDGRLVEISSPDVAAGIFHEISENSKKYDNILSFQLPTWCSNEDITYDDPELTKYRKTNPDTFASEYGAQWARSGTYGVFFPEGLVDRCIRADVEEHSRIMPGVNYYLHVDPANGGDRYTAVLVSKEYYTNSRGKRRIRVRLAKTWIWNPVPGVGLLFNEIDREVINICSKYHPMTVTYDQWNSVQSLQLLRSHGINCVQTSYNRSYKNKIYQALKDMMSYQPEPELWLYNDVQLIGEIKALRYRPTVRGVSLVTDRHGEIKTDDLVDCLAGATAMASENVIMPLPRPVVVQTGYW
ncbi:MAG: terminase large subunit [Methanomassiliicoccales archaeon]|jgi:hypothetical protein